MRKPQKPDPLLLCELFAFLEVGAAYLLTRQGILFLLVLATQVQMLQQLPLPFGWTVTSCWPTWQGSRTCSLASDRSCAVLSQGASRIPR